MGNRKGELWSRLSTEIMDHVLSFLSAPVLCRFRTVCKRWDALICDPEFRALCIRHGRHEARYLVSRNTSRLAGHGYHVKNHGWSFLDLLEKRWYTIKHDGQEVRALLKHRSDVAMAGGMVCQILDARDHNGNAGSLFVSNPITNTSARLPPSPHRYSCMERSIVTLVVDDLASSYKVFLMPNDKGLRQPLVVYDSTTNLWRDSSTDLPAMPAYDVGVHLYVLSSVFFNGLLYVFVCIHTIPSESTAPSAEYHIWSYNYGDDSWKDTCVVRVELAAEVFDNPQLVVSGNRLFLASWLWYSSSMKHTAKFFHRSLDHVPYSGRWAYEISHVNVEDGTRTMVFQMTRAVMKRVFGVPRIHHDTKFVKTPYRFYGLRAFGFRKSIVFLCRSSGVIKVLDLGTRSWDTMPQNPLLTSLPAHEQVLWYVGTPMNLVLPATTPE